MGLKKQTETALVASLLQLLKLRGIYAWRNNSGAFVLGEGKGRRFFRAGLVGGSDILGVVPPRGRFLACEAKVGRNKPTADQELFLAAVRDSGGLACVCYSTQELDDFLAENGV